MTLGSVDDPLAPLTAEMARRLRDVLDDTGFTSPQALKLLEARENDPISSSARGPLLSVNLWRTRDGSPLAVLVRLFLLGVPVEEPAGRAAVAPTALEEWQDAGLLHIAEGQVRPLFRLMCHHGIVVAFDGPTSDGPTPKHVMGVTGTSQALARLTIRRKCGLALDLGTGSGIQAFLAADHSERVLAVDSNPRAVAIATFNARLNGLDNVETRQGDLFEPVRDEKFDLIVSNPPFVVSPENRYLYRDSGLPGDEVSRKVLQESGPLLREGGFAQVLCGWVHVRGEDWRQRVGHWVAATGCDAWVMRSRTSELSAYAEEWALHTPPSSPEAFAAQMEAWLAYYERLGIEAISTGLVTLRNRSTGGPHWFRCDDAPPMNGPAGDPIERAFALRDFLEAHASDQALLGARLRVSPDLRWDQELKATPKGWSVTDSRVRMTNGLVYVGTANQNVLAMLDRCRGQHPLGQVLDQTGRAVGGALDRDGTLAVVRAMIEQGMLWPV